jgi:hypothetical protein
MHRCLPPSHLWSQAAALAVALLLLLPTGLQAQQLTPEQAEELGRAVVETPSDPSRVQSGRSLRGGGTVLYVTEWSDDRVMALDAATGDLIDENFIVDPERLSSPRHAIPNFDGTGIFVSDQIEDLVYEYDLDGNYVGIFAPAGGVDNAILDNLRGIMIAPSGDRLWVTVGSGSSPNAGAIAEFDTEGNYLGNFIEPGTGGLSSPFFLYQYGDALLISDSSTDAIHEFDLDGNFVGVWNDPGINFPQQLASGGKNVLAAGFSNPSGTYEYGPDGSQLAVYTPITGVRGVHELPSGNILVTNGSGVHEITRANALVRTIVSGSAQFFGLGSDDGGTSGCPIGLDFCEDFEDGIPGDWTIFANEFSTGNTPWQAFTQGALGNVARSSWSSAVPEGEVSEDYLATPLLSLGAGAYVQFDAAEAFSGEFGSEYEVLVSTTSADDPAAYATVASYTESDFPLPADGAATFTVDLSAYAGQSVYIAFLHRQNDGDVFYLDNVGVYLGDETGGDDPEVLAYWNFNTSTPGSGGGLGTIDTYDGTGIPADFGDGYITTDFTVNTVPGAPAENNGDLGTFGGTTLNALFEDESGGALAVRGQNNNGRYIQFEFDASGYEDIDLSFAGRGTGTGFSSNQVSYSTDGESFTDLGDPYVSTQSSFELYEFDFGSALDNAATAYVRITFNGATSDTGNNRIDNVIISGTEGDFPPPDGALVFSPSPLVEELESGETGTETVTITNTTDQPVAYDFSQYSGGDRPDVVASPFERPYTARGAKGEDDRAFPQYTPARGEGGPDAFGYTWIDSNEPGGPAFEALDISASGTPVVLQQNDSTFDPLDEGYADIALPFGFSYYGNTYDEVRIWANGILSFDFGYLGNTFSAQTLPNPAPPNAVIAPLWADFDGSDAAGNAGIFTEVLPDGRFVVQYNEWPRFVQSTPNTFQVILSPGGAIKYQYVDLQGSFTASTSIGIENEDGSIGLQVATGNAYAQNGLAVLISAAPTFVTDVDPATGVIPAGGSVDVAVTFDATGLVGGTYDGTLVVETDLDGPDSTFELPVVLVVEGDPACALALDPASFGDVIVGNAATATATVSNTGTDACELTAASASGPFAVEGFAPTSVAPGGSYSFEVVYTPTEPGPDAGTLTVSSPSGDLTAALSGSALGQPTPEVDPDALTVTVMQGSTETTSFTVTNAGGTDAADLEYEVTVVAARPAGDAVAGNADAARAGSAGSAATLGAATRGATGGRLVEGLARADGTAGPAPYAVPDHGPVTRYRSGGVTITHSVSQEIAPLTGVACGSGGSTAENSYFRVFDLAEFGLDGGLDVTSVDVGVETATGVPDMEVRLYRLDGPLSTANLTLVGEATYTLQNTELALVNVPVEGSFAGGETLVVEWFIPNLQSVGGGVYPGSNSAGQTGPTYIASATCGITEPTDFADIGFPEVHWVMNVNGTSGPSLVSVSPSSGTLAPGESDEVTVTVDATEAELGTYAFELIVSTNDPATPSLTVDLTVIVDGVSSEDGAVPTAFSLSQNYPNPFASRTVIEYGLPEPSRVRVDVYDAVGRHVATLVDGEQGAGYHEARWDASGVAAGVYLYRIQAGEHTRTLKMVVVQ